MLGGISLPAFAQIGTSQTATGTNRPLQLPENSPFRDPDLFYLEADSLSNDEKTGILTVNGQVEGRYEDRSLRADQVVYDRNTGRIVASGNVTLIDATGSVQYADKLELSEELEAGTATNYTGRLEGGGVVGARFVNRNTQEEFEFYNAYYTACEICKEDGKTNTPSWRLKAKRVRQDKDTRTIRYNDAVLELLGVPVFYTPYLAHPDPSAKRSSGILTPFFGLQSDKGVAFHLPYYWAIDDYTEATITPRLFTKVNPLLEYQFARNFHTGRIDVEGSFTYSSIFDRDGNAFDDASLFADPDTAPIGKRWRSHFYADGYFSPNSFWDYGFGVQLATDDNYLNRYDLNERPGTRGIYQSESRRNTSQAFLVGQDDDVRFSVSTVGFQDLRSRVTEISEENGGGFRLTPDNDGELPIIAPKIELEAYFTDPVLGGRLKAFGDTTWLTREIGADYGRATGGLDYSKTWIAPGGIEVKPFANARFDYFDLEAETGETNSFTRALGQAGADIRYPFIKSGGKVDWILEPRIQVTQSFGNQNIDDFELVDGSVLLQDSTDIDLDQALLWQSKKSTGYDLWEEGFRADVGGSAIADWGGGRAHLFVGQSYASGITETFEANSGLRDGASDLVGLFELNLGRSFLSRTRVRFDDNENEFRRIDSSLRYRGERLNLSARYYRVETDTLDIDTAPPEEISGTVGFKLTDKWSTRYTGFYDIDGDNFRRQRFALAYQDDCTLIEFTYTNANIDNDAIRDTNGFGIRIALLTLGDTGATN
jgi:LPS-assembly protein